MKTTKLKFTIGAMFFFLLASFTTSKVYSQYTGLYCYFTEDSIGGTNICLSEPIDAYIYWANSGPYNTGDYVDINVDWGDGNNSSYPGTPILVGGGYGYINYISPVHNYAVAGNYTVIVTSLDNYSNAHADTFYFNMSDLCGDVMTWVFMDDGDGVYDGGDMAMPSVPLVLTSGVSYGVTTDVYGYAEITDIDVNQPAYTYEVDPAWLSANGLTVVSPGGGSFSVSGLGSMPQSFLFLLDCGGSSYLDIAVDGYGWGFKPATHEGYTSIHVSNASCVGGPVTSNISLDFDPLLTVFSSYLPGGVITPGNITWTGVNIPFGNFNFYLYYDVPPGTPALTPLAFNVSVTPTSATDLFPANNSFAFNSEVRNSWDPNFKATNVGTAIDVNVQDEIAYTVHFQNLGNADAMNIHIVDTLSTLLDLNSFRILSQSHEGSYSINPTTREIIFTFPNINLVPQSVDDVLSQGYITYTIKENVGNTLGSDIHNTAHIFFDSNPAVVTNTTSNVNVDTVSGIETPSVFSSMTIYPVPANDYVFINGIASEDVTSIQILDLNGRLIETVKNVSNLMIPVNELTNGIYLMEIKSGEYKTTRKICIQH